MAGVIQYLEKSRRIYGKRIRKWFSQELAVEVRGSEFDPQNPRKNAGHCDTHLSSHCWGDRDRQIPEAHWLASLTCLVDCRVMKRTCFTTLRWMVSQEDIQG